MCKDNMVESMLFGILKIKYLQRMTVATSKERNPLKCSALTVGPALGVGPALSAVDQSADRTLHTRNGL